jgi:hypothetical protein
MSEANYDWSTVHKKVFIKTDKQKVADAWLKIDGLNSWFLREAIFTSKSGEKRVDEFRLGDSYIWRWHGYDDDISESGEVCSLSPFEFSFSFAGGSLCTVKIEAYQTGTLLTLTQSNIPTDEKGKSHYHIGCSNGWTFYLTNLKSILEGGLDLRNKDENITGLVHA